MDAPEVLAEAVKFRREQMSMTQNDLAEALTEHGMDVDPTAIVRIEKGSRGVRVEELLALAAALDVTPGDLLAPLHGRTLTFGSDELTSGQVLAWFAGDPKGRTRRTASLEEIRTRRRDKEIIADLIEEVGMISEAMDNRDRAAVMWVAGRTHGTLAALTEWMFTDDELRDVWERYELREDS